MAAVASPRANKGWLVAVGVLLAITHLVAAGPASRPFSQPDRIRYDGQCLTIDGKDTFIFSGSFHYFRCPKELWPERFAKIKAAGFNCVDTYIPWNVHERQAPKNLNDFSHVDLRDLEDWLKMAETNGLYVIARPGPFICAEWTRGGFPGWLITKRPADYEKWSWFRSNDPEYMAWSRHWYRALFPALAQHQITRKPRGGSGVILVFLENEYDHYFNDKSQGEVAIKSLAEEALAQGIDVPLVTCETDCVSGNEDPVLRHVFNVRNCYTGWNIGQIAKPLKEQHRTQPDAPLMIGELQGGWFSFDWDVPPIRPDVDFYRNDQNGAQINNLTLFAIQNGVTGLNYYMLFGGTNPGGQAAKDMATSYDFNAPIRECGGVGEKYLRVAAIGRMLREHGAQLARSRLVEARVTTDQPDVTVAMRQSADGARFLFVRTSQHDQSRNGTAHVQPMDGGNEIVFNYQLEPLGSKIFYLPNANSDAAQGQWLPEPVPAIARPGHLPKPIEIHQVVCRDDAGPSTWEKLPTGASLNDVGIYDNRFVFYRAVFSLDSAVLTNPAGLRARIMYPTLRAGSRSEGNGMCDRVSALVNGRLIGEVDTVSGDLLLPSKILKTGKNEITLLYENSGCIKEGDWTEKQAGVRGIRLLPAHPADVTISDWKMRKIRCPANADAVCESAGQIIGDWQDVEIDKPAMDQLVYNEAAVFRANVSLTRQDIRTGRTGLFVSQMGDYSWVFLNGKKIGENHSKLTSCLFDLARAAHEGSNSLVIVTEDADLLGHEGLGLVKLTWPDKAGIQPDKAMQYANRSAGIAEGWYQNQLDESGWQTHSVPDLSPSTQSFLTWHRLHFRLPAIPSNVWVPWLVRLQAVGDGFIYLNGHLIGRYSEAGAQHDYYLPECWLNSNSGADNLITLSLRPRGKGASIQSAVVMPYSVYAEVR